MTDPTSGANAHSTVGRTVPELVARAARLFPETEAVVTPEIRWTYSDLEQRATHTGRAFVRAGITPGDRVAIWAPNIAQWVQAVLGVHLAGGVAVPLNTRFKHTEAADIINRSGAKIVLSVDRFLDYDYVDALQQVELPAVEQIVVLTGAARPGTISFTDFVDQSAGDTAPDGALPDVAGDDLSDVIYTSGTTGRPKGVMATHAQTVRVFTDWARIVGLRHRDRYLIVNPFFHTFGYKAGIVACLIQGATMIPEPVFDVDRALERIGEQAITMLPGPPTLFLSMLNHPNRDSYDLSSLRLAVTGAASVPVEMIRRMRSELHFDTVLTAYGLTESTGTVSMCRPDDSAETISATSGRAIPDVEVRIVDDDSVEVERGQAGEIVVRGYNVMRGYLDDPEATAAAIDTDGWLHTGDIGVMDEHGNIAVTDRKKDMIIVGGFNAYPAEIENIVHHHQSVAQCAVIGVPDERLGEVPHLFVVARDAAPIDEAEMIGWCRERMANYKVPRAVHQVEALPMNASGKVLKYQLRQPEAGSGTIG